MEKKKKKKLNAYRALSSPQYLNTNHQALAGYVEVRLEWI